MNDFTFTTWESGVAEVTHYVCSCGLAVHAVGMTMRIEHCPKSQWWTRWRHKWVRTCETIPAS